jgi:hypothetical protein
LAHQPVSAWLWSRPVKKARRLGSLQRIAESHWVAVASASSQEISLNWPLPRGPVRRSGFVSLAGEFCCMIPAEPLAQMTPPLTG